MATLKPKDWRRQEMDATVASLAELHADLATFNEWLAANGVALAEAGAATPGVSTPYHEKPDDLRLQFRVQCPDREALAAVTRILLAGAGIAGVEKQMGQTCQVVRRFGRVEVAAWIGREKVCTPLTGTQSGWDCAAFLAEPLAGSAA